MLSGEEVIKVSILACPDLKISTNEPYKPIENVYQRYKLTEEQLPLIPILTDNSNSIGWWCFGVMTQDAQIIFRRTWLHKMYKESEEYLERLRSIYRVKQLGKYKFQILPKE